MKMSTEVLLMRKEFAEQLKILSTPYKSRSHYILVSKKGRIGKQEAQKIWDEIARLREKPNIMKAILSKVMAEINCCVKNPKLCNIE